MIIKYIEHYSNIQPNHIYIEDTINTYTYKEFSSLYKKNASYLLTNKINKGDKVAILMPSNTNFLLVYCSLLYLNCKICPIDLTLKDSDIKKILEDFNPKVIITHTHHEYIENNLVFNIDLVKSYQELHLNTHITNEIPLVLYTSGTTGNPKGVNISKKNLEFSITSIIEWSKIKKGEVELVTLPLTHSFGLGQFHCQTKMGGSIITGISIFDIENFFKYLKRADRLPATPAGLQFMYNNYKDEFLNNSSQLKTMIINTSPMPEKLMKELLKDLPEVNFYIYYGLTEASRSTYLYCNNSIHHLNSVGKPVKCVDIKINSSNNEIIIKGPNVMDSYFPNEHIQNDWFSTGDIGYFDEDGYLYVTGRVNDIINIDGYKINPLQIENFILKRFDIEDCALAYKYNDSTAKNELILYLVFKNSNNIKYQIDGIRETCFKNLAPYEIPSLFKEVNSLPRNNKGKLLRRLL